MPYSHYKLGNGCPYCANNIQLTTEEFIKRAIEVHGDKYDYSKVEYKNSDGKVCIICPKHGEFWQRASGHINNGTGCPKCYGRNKTTDDFVKELQTIYGDKYDYSLIEYIGAFNPVRMICKKHGEFIITPHSLLSGCGCKQCGIEKTIEKQRLTTEEFIKRSKSIHGNKYDYSLVEYVNAKTPVKLICPKHGEFLIIPNSHTTKAKYCGCPKCAESKMETDVRVYCENHDISVIQQKRFEWLGQQRLDFYFPDYNVAIECQGTYHFMPHYSCDDAEDANKYLLDSIKRDELKNKLCLENGVKLFYYVPSNLMKFIPISKIYNKENTFSSIEEIFKIFI